MGKRSLENIKKNILKTKRSIKKLKSSKRRERKIKLIKLGTIFRILNLLEEDQETILGFLETYKNISDSQKEKFTKKGEILFRVNMSFDNFSLEGKKHLFYLMIRKSALLEKLKIQLENPFTLMGFIETYKNISNSQKNFFKKRGEILFEKKKEIEIISQDEKIFLLGKSIQKNLNLTQILRDEFNTTIHSLNKEQFKIILDKYFK